MSKVRDYLYEKACLPEGEWLRREPRTTHLEILNAVRCFRVECEIAGRVAYNDEAEQVVEREAGDLPEHRRHADPERNRLTDQLGHEVYIAQCLCADEENARRAEELRAQGFGPLEDAVPGRRYDVAPYTIYSGHEEPTYHAVQERCKLVEWRGGGAVFLQPRKRVNGILVGAKALVREAS